MRTVRMFGRAMTQYDSPMTVRIKSSAGEHEFKVTGYTPESAEGKALAQWRKTNPNAVVHSISTELR